MSLNVLLCDIGVGEALILYSLRFVLFILVACLIAGKIGSKIISTSVDARALNRRGCARFAIRGNELFGIGRLNFFERAHELGDVVGTFNLAVCYKDGVGVPKNPYLAYVLFKEAAKQGDPDAIFWCGALCAQEGNDKEALEWFRKGQRSSYKCLFRLARAYEQGLGTPVNRRYAKILRNDAEEMKNRLAGTINEILAEKLTTFDGERTFTHGGYIDNCELRRVLREDF